ncbi:growth-regulating factor 8-like protein [Tanacetum coccineum]
MESSNYTTGGEGGGNERSRFPIRSECDVGLALNMQYVDTNHPTKKINFMPDFHGASGGGGHTLFDQFLTTSNQVSSRTLFKSNTGGEMGNVTFTDSQWHEFEKQKMFYKHFMSSAAVPPQLLVPLSCQSNRSDSEPWRCKRTDGKKWRCSRDVLPDQKYCERHLHKNRPRSRKPVETHTQTTNTKNLNSKNNNNPTLPPAPNMTSSCQQSRCTEWFMKSDTNPLSSSNHKIQKSMHSPSVGTKRDHFFQNLEGYHHDFIERDNCSLTLMQPGGNVTCEDQDFFQMGVGMLNANSLNQDDQWVHQGSWLGGPLGEALCPVVVSSLNPPPHVPSPRRFH